MDGVIFGRPDQAITTPRQAAQAIHQQASHSFTLMRQAVARPKQTPAIKADLKRRFKVPKPLKPVGDFTMRPTAARLNRAKEVVLHSKVNRFGRSNAPLPRTTSSPTTPPMIARISAKVSAVARPASGAAASASASTTALALARPMPGLSSAVSHQKLEDMLDRALTQADAHKRTLQAQLNRSFWNRWGRRGKLLLSAAVVLVAAASLSLAYMRVPAVAAKVASMRSGVNARAPGFLPAGFKLASTDYKAGFVSLRFNSPTGDLTLGQQASGLNGESLRTGFVATQSKLYQTSQYGGVTVYTYSPTGSSNLNATWVNNGVWYTIANGAGLGSDQLIRIAQSL